MFADALDLVRPFTLPVIISRRYFDGSVECSCATFIVLNKDGWILTAAHVLNDMQVAKQHAIELGNYKKFLNDIANNPHFTKHIKAKHIKNAKTNPKWIVNYSYWWGLNGTAIGNLTVSPFMDLATGQLSSFKPELVKKYPVFRNPVNPPRIGCSLCRLGFPFHNVQATFDEATGSFQIANGILPVPQFPNEGIYTRDCVMIEQNSKQSAKFLETSSAGLRGQSGGPIFDVKGRVCALQSRTTSFPLGIAAEFVVGKTKSTEQQFLNVGLGSHLEEIIKFLNSAKVDIDISTE